MKEKRMKVRYKMLFIVIPLLIIACVCFLQFSKQDKRDQQNITISNTGLHILQEKQKQAKRQQAKPESGREKAIEILQAIREKFSGAAFIGWLSTGEGGINEPICYAKDDRYLTHNIYGEYAEEGAVFLYQKNASPLDECATYFGHRMDCASSRFSLLARYTEYKDRLQTAQIVISQGILSYRLAFVAAVSRPWYESYETWTKSGLSAFAHDAKKEGFVIDEKLAFDETKKYAVFSTCNKPSINGVVVGVYELVNFEY